MSCCLPTPLDGDKGDRRHRDPRPKNFQPFVERLRGAFPDIHVTVEDAFAAGDQVAVRWSATITHQGNQFGVPPSGKSIFITGISMVRIANGQIVEGWDNWDQLTISGNRGHPEAGGEPDRRHSLISLI